MALSSRTKNKLMDNINQAFDMIGYATGTRMPRCESNTAPAAWKLFLAHHLASRANKLKELAEIEAVRAGVLFDKMKNPKPEGTREVIYNGEIVSVICEVRKASTRIDSDKLIEYLSAAGVDQDLIDEGVRLSSKMTRAAHVFTTYLVTEDANGK